MLIGSAPSSAAPTRPGTLFFHDARSCKSWLKAMPINQPTAGQKDLLDALRILNRTADFAPLERLTALELMRERVAFFLREQRKRYWSKAIPLSASESAAWQVSTSLVAEMEAGYRRAMLEAHPSGGVLAAHVALISQRIIRYIGLSMLLSSLVYRRFDTGAWMRLHLQWIEADERGLVTTRVRDSVGAAEVDSSIAQAYAAVLLGQLVETNSLTVREMDFVDVVLRRLAHKVALRRHPPVAEGGVGAYPGRVCAVDLLSNAGAAFHAGVMPAENILFVDTSELSRSLRGRYKRLSEGAELSELELPSDWDSADAQAMLLRLHRAWCDGVPPPPPATVPIESEATVCFGIAETHFFLSGGRFDQPGVEREMTRQEINDLAMFGKVSEATIRSRYAEYNYGTEAWSVIDRSRMLLRLTRPTNSAKSVAIGRLLGVRLGTADSFAIGVIRALDDDGRDINVSVGPLPGRAEAVAVRGVVESRMVSQALYVQGFRLPCISSVDEPESLVLPVNLARVGGKVDIYHPQHGRPKQVVVKAVVERGVEFDRVTIA